MKASKWMYNVMFALAAVLFLPLGLMANNIRIIGTPSVEKRTDKKTATINFTLAWDNSWKSSKPANYDAAWIFVKCWDGDQWNHVYLKDTVHTPGNPGASGYRVRNRYKTKDNCPMKIEQGYSKVYRKWHVNPDESADTGVVGVFLYRKDSLGSGNIYVPGISLVWDYTTQGFVYDDDLVVKVFAVEMVYVPEGAFWLGGKGINTHNWYSFTANGGSFGTPFRVRGEDSIACRSDANPANLGVSEGCYGFEVGNNYYLPARFPKGFRAFYIMKYELSQQAYCEFLNTLNQGQQNGRIYAQGSIESLKIGHSFCGASANWAQWWRNSLEVKRRAPSYIFGCDINNNDTCDEVIKVIRTIDGYTDTCELSKDGQDIAMNMICMYDLLAYADFAGLRPMTELEYEKACRGDQEVKNDEFAWGSFNLTHCWDLFHTRLSEPWVNTDVPTTKIKNTNRGDERVPEGYNAGAVRSSENWWWHWCYVGPLRVGAFADSTTVRAAAGASYWGVMNMSDNVQELCIDASYQQYGRKFEGVHGDGQLKADGKDDVTEWNGQCNSWYYYIPRGIRYQHTRNDWCCNPCQPWGPDHTNGMHWWGTVSSRQFTQVGKDMGNRDPNDYMFGIRCVRTAGGKSVLF